MQKKKRVCYHQRQRKRVIETENKQSMTISLEIQVIERAPGLNVVHSISITFARSVLKQLPYLLSNKNLCILINGAEKNCSHFKETWGF